MILDRTAPVEQTHVVRIEDDAAPSADVATASVALLFANTCISLGGQSHAQVTLTGAGMVRLAGAFRTHRNSEDHQLNL